MAYIIDDNVRTSAFWKSDKGFAFSEGDQVQAFVLDSWSFAILSSLETNNYWQISNIILSNASSKDEHEKLLQNCEATLKHLFKLGLVKHVDDT